MAFITELDQLLDFIEAQIKYVVTQLINQHLDDLEFFDKYVEKGLVEMLRGVIETPFSRLKYVDAIETLSKKKDWK